MSVKENKDLATRYIKGASADKGDIVKLLTIMDKYFDPKFVMHAETGDMNLEQYKQVATSLYKAFPDFNATIEHIVAEGDKVVVGIIMRGTHNGQFLGIAPTGRKFTEAAIDIIRIAGEKIAEIWAVHDTFGLMIQLGAVPNPFPPAK